MTKWFRKRKEQKIQEALGLGFITCPACNGAGIGNGVLDSGQPFSCNCVWCKGRGNLTKKRYKEYQKSLDKAWDGFP